MERRSSRRANEPLAARNLRPPGWGRAWTGERGWRWATTGLESGWAIKLLPIRQTAMRRSSGRNETFHEVGNRGHDKSRVKRAHHLGIFLKLAHSLTSPMSAGPTKLDSLAASYRALFETRATANNKHNNGNNNNKFAANYKVRHTDSHI